MRAPPARPLDAWIGDIRVRGVVLDLRQELALAGVAFLEQLGVSAPIAGGAAAELATGAR